MLTTLSPGRQPVQNLQATFENLVVGRIAQTKMRVAPAEDSAGNAQQVIADRLRDKFLAGAPGRLGEEVKRPTGFHKLVAVLQAIDHAIALALVVSNYR